jgi:hypothetical protein
MTGKGGVNGLISARPYNPYGWRWYRSYQPGAAERWKPDAAIVASGGGLEAAVDDGVVNVRLSGKAELSNQYDNEDLVHPSIEIDKGSEMTIPHDAAFYSYRINNSGSLNVIGALKGLTFYNDDVPYEYNGMINNSFGYENNKLWVGDVRFNGKKSAYKTTRYVWGEDGWSQCEIIAETADELNNAVDALNNAILPDDYNYWFNNGAEYRKRIQLPSAGQERLEIKDLIIPKGVLVYSNRAIKVLGNLTVDGALCGGALEIGQNAVVAGMGYSEMEKGKIYTWNGGAENGVWIEK